MVTSLADQPAGWSPVAKALHWIVAVAIVVQLPLGVAARNWPLSPRKLDLFVLHKSIGLAILLVVVVRVAWRAVHAPPPLPATMSSGERRAAHASHAVLYALALALPLSGWIVSAASNVPFLAFWRIPVPAIVAPDELLADRAALVHLVLAILLGVALVAHVAAALWHHYVRHDDVLRRMLPGRRVS